MAEEKKKSDKRVLVISLVLVGFAVVVFAVLIWRTTRGPVGPTIPTGPEPFIEEVVSRATSSAESAKEWIYKEERAAYSVTGSFLSPLQTVGDSLRGTFVIDGDPRETPLTVVIKSSRKDGHLSLGRYREVFAEGQMLASMEPLVVIQESVKEGYPVELRFMYHPTVTYTSEQVRVRGVLEALLEDNWEIPSGLTLTPVGVGIIE